MTIFLHADPVPLRVDDRGVIYVADTRVTLDILIDYWRSGMRPEDIARGLPTVSLADVLGALSYYHRHRTEVDAYLAAGDRQAEALGEQIEAAAAERLAGLRSKFASESSEI